MTDGHWERDASPATQPATSEPASRIANLALAGLLVAILVSGLAGIAINNNIHATVERAVVFDLGLEERGDDLRVAILEVRHYHRDLLLNNPDGTRIGLWQARHAILLDEIGALDVLLAQRPADDIVALAAELRELATSYYGDFHDAVDGGIDSQEAFRVVAEDLLVPIDRMASIALSIDRAGEERAAASFRAIDEASRTGSLILIGVIVGLGAVGAVLGYVMLGLVREQRRLVLAEQVAAAQLAATAQAKSDFIADASHELRTPLTVLRGNAEIGLSMGADGDRDEILREIVSESTRMSRLVDDLLFLARSDSASVPLARRAVDIGEASRDVAVRAEVLARERGAQLVTDLRGTGTARFDAMRIDQAVLILVDNAAKYGPPGGTIELDVGVEDGHVVIEVRDRGPGISPKHATRIFERFYRVEGGQRPSGSGLGLPIAAAIIEGHGGRIAALPRDGGGTVMRVELPLNAA